VPAGGVGGDWSFACSGVCVWPLQMFFFVCPSAASRRRASHPGETCGFYWSRLICPPGQDTTTVLSRKTRMSRTRALAAVVGCHVCRALHKVRALGALISSLQHLFSLLGLSSPYLESPTPMPSPRVEDFRGF